MSSLTALDNGAENRTPPFRLRRSSSESAAVLQRSGSKPAAGGRPPLSPLPHNVGLGTSYARSPAADGSCTPLSLWSSCSDVPTPESDGSPSSLSPSMAADSDSPWSPPSPRRAAWLRASPTTKTARRVDALLTLATRCIATEDQGEDEVPTPAATPVAENAPARLGQSPDMPDSLKRAVANYALWKARSEALQAIGQEKRVAASVAGMHAVALPPLATPPAHVHASNRQAAADLSPETSALVTQSHGMQQELLLSQLNAARSTETQLRTDLQLAEARAQQLLLALEASKHAHMTDLDAARATLLVCDNIIQESLLANARLRRFNDRLQSRVTSLKQAAAAVSGIARAAAAPAPRCSSLAPWLQCIVGVMSLARVRPVARVALDDGAASCTVVLRLRL